MIITTEKYSIEVMAIMLRGSVAQNTTTVNSDKDYYVVFKYLNLWETDFSFPTDIQKQNGELYTEIINALQGLGYNLTIGDVVFKEVRSLLGSKTSSEKYDYFFVSETFMLYSSESWDIIRTISPLLYNRVDILNHLWRKVNSLYSQIEKQPKVTSRFMYYSYLYNQVHELDMYTPFILDEEEASDIVEVKLGGEAHHSLTSYKLDVENKHLTVSNEVETNEINSLLLNSTLCYGKNTEILLPVKSSAMELTLHTDKNTMNYVNVDVRFKSHIGDVFPYAIPNKEMNRWLDSESIGRYYKQHIEKVY